MEDAEKFLDKSAISAFVVEETYVIWPGTGS